MGRGKKYTAEQIVSLLRQIEVGTANGKMTPQACKEVGITEQTYYSGPGTVTGPVGIWFPALRLVIAHPNFCSTRCNHTPVHLVLRAEVTK